MAIETVVASAVAILAPYVAAGAKKAAEVAGEAVAVQAGKLLQRVRAWFAGDGEAVSALESFEKNPSLYGSVLSELLRQKAEGNPEIAKELTELLDAMGPRVEVFQKVKKLAGAAVGLDIANWEKGLAFVSQDVETVEDGGTLTGAKIGR